MKCMETFHLLHAWLAEATRVKARAKEWEGIANGICTESLEQPEDDTNFTVAIPNVEHNA